jgi:hypothetical protein
MFPVAIPAIVPTRAIRSKTHGLRGRSCGAGTLQGLSSGHRPFSRFGRSGPEYREAREVGCGGEEAEVGSDSKRSAHP